MAVKKDTTIDHKERLNRVLIYIQENINSPMSLETLSGVAFFSPFHFHRIFKAFVGETVNDYIRRIRLEHAALKLSYSYEPITSIALASGYETPSAFTKAFRQHFGENPTDFRDSRKISLSLSNNLLHLNYTNIEVKTTMKAEIRMLPEQKILFIRKTGGYEKAASEAWAVLMEFTYSHRLIERNTRIIGVSFDNPEITSESKLRYDACISLTKDIKPEGEINVRKLKRWKIRRLSP